MGPLVVLVGPNASGKSSIIESLVLLQAIAKGEDVFSALKRFGGYDSTVWGGETDRNIAIAATGNKTTYKLEMAYEGEPVGCLRGILRFS